METFKTEETLLRKSNSSENYYFRTENGDIVIVNAEIAKKWDTIDAVRVTKVHYEQRMVDGKLVAEPWDRMEVTGIVDSIAGIRKKTMKLEAATNYAKAKNASLKIEDLEESVKEELEQMLR